MARSSDLPFPFSIFADRSFQASEIRRVIAVSMLYLGITTLLVGLFYHHMLGTLLEGTAPLLFVSEDARLAVEAVPALGDVLGRWMLAMLGVNVLVTAALALFVTRRLGQPILAIKRTLREIGAGNLDVRLRAADADAFGEIANELTQAMHTVRERVAAAKAGIEQASDTTEAGLDAAGQARGLDDCRTALDWFQVDGQAPRTGNAGAA